MPRPRQVEQFSNTYWDFIEALPPSEVRVECGTAARAISLRGQLYSFLAAVKKDARSAAGERNPRSVALYHKACKIMIKLEESTLIFVPRDKETGALILEEELRKMGLIKTPEQIEAEKEAFLKKLRASQEAPREAYHPTVRSQVTLTDEEVLGRKS